MSNNTGMIETLTLNREQAVNMLGTDVDSLTEDKKECDQYDVENVSIKYIPPNG